MKKTSRTKRLLMFFGFVCLFALFVGIAKGIVGVTDDVFWKWYYVFAVFIILGVVIFNICYHRIYEKKMNQALKLLDDQKPQEYIDMVASLREKAKSRYLYTFFTINLSVGYYDLQDYKKAIEIIESVSDMRLMGILKMVHKLNLCCYYFYDNQWEKAQDIYGKNQKLFNSYRKHFVYSGHIAVMDIFIDIIKGDYEAANEKLKAAKIKWDTPRLQVAYLSVEEMIKPHLPETEN